MKNILTKIYKVSGDIGGLKKDAKNPFFKKDYISLDAIIEALSPALQKHKLAVIHTTDDAGVHTTVYDIESEELICSTFPWVDMDEGRNKAQAAGAVISYARRYNLTCLFNLHAADDDAQSLNGKSQAKPKPAPEFQPVKMPGSPPKLTAERFAKFMGTLTDLDSEKATKALDAVRARGFTLTAAQKKELEAIGVDAETLQSKIPF